MRVKENAVALVHRAATAPSQAHRLSPGDAVLMSSVTDPYQPLERHLELTRSILEALVEIQPRLTIQTRSPIVTRDIDVLSRFERVRVNLSVPTDSEDVRLRYEPHAPAIEARLRTAETLARAGFFVTLCIAPMLPIREPEAFGVRLAATGAKSFVTQYFRQAKVRFASSTPDPVLGRLAEDRWSRRAYDAARGRIQAGLGDELALREW